MREMLRGLADRPTALAEPPQAEVQQAAGLDPQPAARWWRVGKLFRRHEAAHNQPQ